MSDDDKALIEQLRDGLIYRPKRWSGDTYADLGGRTDIDATEELMRKAAERIKDASDDCDAALARAEAAEAQVALLREALQGALFECVACAENEAERSFFPADMLRLDAEGNAICQEMWDGLAPGDGWGETGGDMREWHELPPHPTAAALAATPADALAERDARAWRPIETAPRDGTRVLVGWADNAPLEIAHWQEGSSAFSLDDAWEFSPQPTHWTPLPEPPK